MSDKTQDLRLEARKQGLLKAAKHVETLTKAFKDVRNFLKVLEAEHRQNTEVAGAHAAVTAAGFGYLALNAAIGLVNELGSQQVGKDGITEAHAGAFEAAVERMETLAQLTLVGDGGKSSTTA